MCWRSLRSSAESGSSSSSTAGSTASARATATRWRWPPDSSVGFLWPWPVSATSSSSSPARRRRSSFGTPRHSRPKATFSQTGISGNSARFWKISAVGRRFGPTPVIGSPPIAIVPVDGSRKPEIIRRIVVLPQPEGPRIEKNSPARIDEIGLVHGDEVAEPHRDALELDILAAHGVPTPCSRSRPAAAGRFAHRRPADASPTL